MDSSARWPRRRASSRRWIFGTFLVALLVVAAAVLIIPSDDVEDPPAPAATSSATSPPADQPLRVQESAEFTVPDTLRLESRDFEAEAGSTYLLEFAATMTKPEDSPGAAMYLGANLACGGPNGGTLRSVGGTQNARTGEQISIRNQFLLEIAESGEHSCRLQVFSPNPNVDARGTTTDVETQWSATRVEGIAVEASADERLPRLIAPDERAAAFGFEVDLEPGTATLFDMLGTVHVTTCTEVEGSSEDGRTWCQEREVDEGGSVATFTYRADVLDDAGVTCDSRTLDVTREHIDRRTHHSIFHVARSVEHPANACGDTVRIVVAVKNDGPAPLLVHRGSSNLVVVSDT